MPWRSWFGRTVPLLALGAVLSGCAFEGPQSTLDPAGPVAQAQRDLFMWTYYLSWFVLVLVGGAMIYAIARFRRRPGDDSLPPQTHGRLALEIGLTILPVLIVIAVAVPTVRTIFRTEVFHDPTPQDLIVNVRGYQWWWAFEYPELGIVTANELHVPVGRRVVLNLASADVLHSFWVPRIAGKRDLIPNQDNQLWFEVDEPGLYRGQCAELCLGAHAYMRFRVIADDEAAFDDWVAAFQAAQQPQPVQADPLIERGRQLFAQKGCGNCHTIDNYRPGITIGDPDFPNLTNFGLRTSVAAGVLENTPENLAAWLRDPQAVKPGNRMPTLWSENDPNRDDEIAAIVAYLESLGTLPQPQAELDTLEAIEVSALGGSHGNR